MTILTMSEQMYTYVWISGVFLYDSLWEECEVYDESDVSTFDVFLVEPRVAMIEEMADAGVIVSQGTVMLLLCDCRTCS
jgi:hypothetical protein